MDYSEKIKKALEYQQCGNFEETITICEEIIHIQPENIDAIRLLAISYYQFQNYDLSLSYIHKALQLEPDDFFAFFLLGNISQVQGNLKEALTFFHKSIELNPSFADSYYNLAIVFDKKGELDKAILSYERALHLNPTFTDVYNNLGTALHKIGRLDEAIPYLRKAIELNPNYILAFNNLGMVYKEKGQFDEALASFQKAIELNPSFADAYCNLAIILIEKGHTDKAIENLQKAIEINPSFADAYYNLAVVMNEKNNLDEAIASFQKAIEINPSFADAYTNFALVSEEKGHHDEALTYYRKALQIRPDDAEVHWNLSLTLLSLGKFTQGWREYEWRLQVKDFKQHRFPYPRWDGRPLKGKSIIISAEQGVGDEIMFASCLPEVIPQAELCMVECDKRLMPLFARSFPKTLVIERLDSGGSYRPDIPLTDMQIPMGSLPKFRRPDLGSFPQQGKYLIPDNHKTEIWRKRYTELGEGIKIGISWRGGSKPAEKFARSTILAQWKTLFSVQGVHFINLQYGDCTNELMEAREKLGLTMHDWKDSDPLTDLDGFAAQVSVLDLVISVDNATVHMAGALGVPVWVLLPFSCDWRWMRDFEDTPWYKTVRLIRQNTFGDWNGVFERVTSDLMQYISTGVMPGIKCSYKSSIPSFTTVNPSFPPVPSENTYRCAVIIPVGPGHENLYQECIASIEKSFAGNKGRFSEIIPIRINDPEGKLGRSKARNLGIKQAAEQNVDWIFFIDADDLMAPSAFEYVSPYLDEYDGIWGSIWPIEKGETTAKERPQQLPFLYTIEDVLSGDPFVTLGIGHFVNISAALSTPFDESLDAGEDFDYYLRVWEHYRCIKIPLPFWYHRRGLHSHGPRSATGLDWRQKVERIINKRYTQSWTIEK